MTEASLTQEVVSAMQSMQGDIFARQGDLDGVRDVIREKLDQTFGYMFADIEREIHLAEAKEADGVGCCKHFPGGGNYLTALGLLCYTEYMGQWITGKYGQRTGTENFTSFFRLMGPRYAELVGDGVKVYDVFRNGMAHQYTPKKFCEVRMLGADIKPTPDCGIVRSGEEWPEYRFIVRRYFADFKRVCFALYDVIVEFPTMPVDVSKDKS